jgi:hypothetical protein
MGINVIHFSSGYAEGLFDPHISCPKIWTRHTWQQPDQVSHEDLANAIAEAERTISEYFNWNVAPQWTVEEEYETPNMVGHVRGTGWNFNRQRSAMMLKRGKVIAGGRRAVTLIRAEAPIIYDDPDGDGFKERATITVPTSVTDRREVKLYVAAKNADPRWELRPIDNLSIAGGTLTIRADSWVFMDPDLQSRFPGASGWQPIDISDSTNFLEHVDIYREYNDTSAAAAEFTWSQNECSTDEWTAQNGYMRPLYLDGAVTAVPGTYATAVPYTVSRIPDRVRLWYYSGHISQEYRAGFTTDPLDHNLAQAIAYLATARLDREICECNKKWINDLRYDMAFSSAQGNFIAISENIVSAPFGSKRGEYMAWLAVKNLDRYMQVALV